MAENSQLITSAAGKAVPNLSNILDFNDWRNTLVTQGARVAKFRRYAEGEHDAPITDQMRSMLRLQDDDANLDDFNINYMDIVIQTPVDRLHVDMLSVVGSDAAQEWVEALKKSNKFDSMQSLNYEGSIRDGNAFVMVSPKRSATGEDSQSFKYERPLWTNEPAYDGFSGTTVLHDAEGSIMIAIKLFNISAQNLLSDDADEADMMQINVYVPGKIYKYKGTSGSSDAELINVEDSNLESVPFVQFSNRRDNFSDFGKSEIRVGMAPQNALNRAMHSMKMVSDLSAFPIRIAKGFIPDGDIEPGVIWTVYVEDTNGNIQTQLSDEELRYMQSVGIEEFGAGNFSMYLEEISHLSTAIGQITRTPAPEFMAGDNASGESLKQREIGLLGKVERYQEDNTEAWREIIILSAEVDAAFGTAPAPFDSIVVVWRDAELRNENEQLRTLAQVFKDMPGVFSNKLFRMRIGAILGISKEDIEADELELEKEMLFVMTQSFTPGQIPANAAATPGEDTPENIDATEALNGAQIKSASDILDKVATGSISDFAAEQLLISVGINETTAKKMVSEQKSIEIVQPAESAPTAATAAAPNLFDEG